MGFVGLDFLSHAIAYLVFAVSPAVDESSIPVLVSAQDLIIDLICLVQNAVSRHADVNQLRSRSGNCHLDDSLAASGPANDSVCEFRGTILISHVDLLLGRCG